MPLKACDVGLGCFMDLGRARLASIIPNHNLKTYLFSPGLIQGLGSSAAKVGDKLLGFQEESLTSETQPQGSKYTNNTNSGKSNGKENGK